MIPAFLTSRFGPLASKLIFFGGIALLAAGALLLTYCTGRSDGKSGEVVKQQAREIEVRGQVGTANEAAADRRVQDVITAAQQEKELTNALAATKDPDRQRVLRGCIILRQQGRNTADIPACR